MYHPQQPPYPPGPPPYGYDPGPAPHVLTLPKPPSRAPWLVCLVTLGAAAGGGHWLWEERAGLQAELAAVAERDQARQPLETRLKALEKENAELLAARELLQRSVDEKASEIAELKGTHDKLQDKMREEIARGDVLLTTSEGRLRVDLVDKILFESGDARISKRGEGVLAKVGAVLASIEGKQIQVSGHTDDERISEKLQAQFPTNWELSVARATNVVRFLQEQAGVPPDRLVASGHGEHQPVASNKTARGRARNRRIEILLTPSLAPRHISKAKLKQQVETAAKPVQAQAQAPARTNRGARR